MRTLNHFIIVFLLAALTGCGQRNAPKQESGRKSFEMPHVPAMITAPDERSAYIVRHYWDHFDFTDTVSLWEDGAAEQALANYIAFVGMAPPAGRSAAIQQMLAKAQAGDSVVFARFLDLYEKYLYDPNSPMRNEDLYIPVLEFVVASPKIDELNKLRPERRLRMALKNRVGERAADFGYTLASGGTGRLYGVKSDYTLLFFNNPDCPACKEVLEGIVGSPLLTEMIRTGRLSVLAVYPDEDIQAWKNYLPNIPPEWINSYNRSMKSDGEELYDLKAIPTLYLLGQDKTVLVKDAVSVRGIEEYLMRIAYGN